ncbi:MAG TPA: hypothetical protein VFV52_08375, partial [Bacilli bacterium]|nr:hypothetical protein [Bacilli bacterium]
YFDVKAGQVKVKSRPVLIVGYERNYSSPTHIDYEYLPISTMKNASPDPTYDVPLNGGLHAKIGLNEVSFVRTHKTSWNHVKHIAMHPPIGDLRATYPDLYNHLLLMNERWVNIRTKNNLYVEFEVLFDQEKEQL